jgi:hypothetical protein
VLAGAIPQPSLLALLALLALRWPVLAKPASRDPVTPRLVAASLADVDAELGHCVAIADFRSSDEACLRALLEADCVVATGTDASISALAARVAPPRRTVRAPALGRGARPRRARRRGPWRKAAARRRITGMWDRLPVPRVCVSSFDH